MSGRSSSRQRQSSLEVVRKAGQGHLVEHEPLLCVSTSFGCHDGDKVYLEWDLAVPAVSADDAARTGLRRLYPEVPGRYRTQT